MAAEPLAAGDAFVLDASVTATWLLPDEHTDASRRLFAGVRSGDVELHAPDLWLVECGNIIVNAVRRKRTTAANALALWQVLDSVRTRCELYRPEPPQVPLQHHPGEGHRREGCRHVAAHQSGDAVQMRAQPGQGHLQAEVAAQDERGRRP